jgi:hypothetical protein
MTLLYHKGFISLHYVKAVTAVVIKPLLRALQYPVVIERIRAGRQELDVILFSLI